MPDVLLMTIVGAIAGFLTAKLAQWALERRTYNLECDVQDLKNKILKEIKTRASHSRDKTLDHDPEILKAPPEPAKPWWMPYVGNKDGKAV